MLALLNYFWDLCLLRAKPQDAPASYPLLVLTLLANRKQLTAPALCDMLDLAINTASNRLKRLFDRRLVRREYEVSNRGLQYYYFFWD